MFSDEVDDFNDLNYVFWRSGGFESIISFDDLHDHSKYILFVISDNQNSAYSNIFSFIYLRRVVLEG